MEGDILKSRYMEPDTEPPGRHYAAPALCKRADLASSASAVGRFPDLPVKEGWQTAQMRPPGPATGLQAHDKAAMDRCGQ